MKGPVIVLALISVSWLLIASGCALPEQVPATGQGATSTPVTATPSLEAEEVNTPPASKLTPSLAAAHPEMLAQAMLAKRLGLKMSDVRIISVTEEEMPLQDLGCPPSGAEKGITQPAIVIGQRVELEAGGQRYVYHVHGLRAALCEPKELRQGIELIGVKPMAEAEETTAARLAVAAAQKDLIHRLGKEVEISVESVEPVQWPDSSLGCPEPGKMYAQVITPGHRVILRAGDQTYEYHTAGTHAVLCPSQGESAPSSKPEAAGGSQQPDGGQSTETAAEQGAVAQAKETLANELGVAADSIKVESVEAVQWRDSSLGCPEPGKMYLQVITPGFRIRLSVGDRIYEYHSGPGRVIRCEKPAERP
ncbi:MAG TPA: hypothetical protein EYH31_10220 [Anaerolineae bacterium]|nr:hypothetical protein [Anaerolineae bacterium]